MTITFSRESVADAYLAFGVNRAADPNAADNSHTRAQPTGTAALAPITQPGRDSADFSQASTLVATALSDADLRAERIATLRLSIANGTYRIPASTVADSLLHSTAADGD